MVCELRGHGRATRTRTHAPFPATPASPLQVVKLLFEYIKQKRLKRAANRQQIRVNKAMATIFPKEGLTIWNIHTHLSKHLTLGTERGAL